MYTIRCVSQPRVSYAFRALRSGVSAYIVRVRARRTDHRIALQIRIPGSSFRWPPAVRVSVSRYTG